MEISRYSVGDLQIFMEWMRIDWEIGEKHALQVNVTLGIVEIMSLFSPLIIHHTSWSAS